MAQVVKLRNIKRALSLKPNDAIIYKLSGRVHNFRPYRSFNFINLIDGSSRDHLQVIVSRDILNKPELGSYITCLGKLVASRGSQQAIEFKVNELKYLGECDPLKYPLAMSTSPTASTRGSPSNNWYRRFTHLRPRAEHFSSLLRVRSELELSLCMIMKQMDFFRVHTPSLTSNDSEASSDLFTVQRTKLYSRSVEGADDDDSESNGEESSGDEEDEEECRDGGGRANGDGTFVLGNRDAIECSNFANDSSRTSGSQSGEHTSEIMPQRIIRDGYFNKDVFLITSAQLHLESLAAALSRVYTISTAFRAENSISTRHLCEFSMFELEESNINDLEPLMNRAESIIKFVGQYLSQISEHKTDFNYLSYESNANGDIYEKLSQNAFIRMSYQEALRTLRDKTDFSGDTSYGSDIGRIQEKKLLDYCNNIPIFITNYPKQLKPFYMKCDTGDREALCFDLIAPHGGEICGGSLREDSYDKLLDNLKKATETSHHQQQTPEQPTTDNLRHFEWYLDSRRFGSFPHGGFGIGIERLIQTLLGIKNIKDTTAFPRWTGHCPM